MTPALQEVLPSALAHAASARCAEGLLVSGALIADSYRLLDKIGEGAMGTVWAAEQVGTGRRVALKVLKVATQDARVRFLREAWAASAARHPNVVDVLDVVETDGDTLVLVMELLVGDTLGARLRRDGRLPVAEACALLLGVTDAVASIHELGMIHRDLKPDNVFLSDGPDGGAPCVKVLDFGVAKLTARDGAALDVDEGLFTTTEGMLGTPYYMAPEQVFAEQDIDTSADVWSMGVTLYECLTGTRPTEAPNVGQVLKRITMAELAPISGERCDLPEDLAALVTRMLTRDRAVRPTLDEIRAVLSPYAAARPAATASPLFSYDARVGGHEASGGTREFTEHDRDRRERRERGPDRCPDGALGECREHGDVRRVRPLVGFGLRAGRCDAADRAGAGKAASARRVRRDAMGCGRALRDPPSARTWWHGHGIRGVRRALAARRGAQGSRRGGRAGRHRPPGQVACMREG